MGGDGCSAPGRATHRATALSARRRASGRGSAPPNASYACAPCSACLRRLRRLLRGPLHVDALQVLTLRCTPLGAGGLVHHHPEVLKLSCSMCPPLTHGPEFGPGTPASAAGQPFVPPV